MQNFPASVVKLWNEWNVRVMVLTSLCLQIVLIVFGNRRKYIARNWIGIVTWMAYLSADWVAAVARPLHEAFGLFKIFRRLYANLILDYHELQHCYDIMERVHSAEDVFKQVVTELGLMYDVLYTKASVVYSLKGVNFRSISLLCNISTFVIFCFAIDKKLYSTIDITLTYLLSLGAIVLELYAIMILVSTDWSLYWLSKQKHPLAYHIYQAISWVRSNYLSNGKRWSESMEQFNLIDFCLKEKPPKCAGIQRVLCIYEMAEKYWHTTSKDVPIKMKQLNYFQETDRY